MKEHKVFCADCREDYVSESYIGPPTHCANCGSAWIAIKEDPQSIFADGLEGEFFGVDNNCFKIGNIVFEAMEDAEDGYRSLMKEIQVRKDVDGLIFFRAALDHVKVVRVDEDIWNLVSLEDGHVWLEIGTDYADSYYPFFVFTYHPRDTGEANPCGGDEERGCRCKCGRDKDE